jgi:D-psicose/D-tagatose/L-ribulose 3-epimerase
VVKFAYVLPDPLSYKDWVEFENDVACVKQAGYDAVELQIADPLTFDKVRVAAALSRAALPLCAFQTGASYATHGNCLCTAEPTVRRRTTDLLKHFADLAATLGVVMVVGSLQGRLTDEPDRTSGSARIAEALRGVGGHATSVGAVIAFEPVNHGEVGFHNTIAEAAGLVRQLALPGVRLMVDAFHMNIEESDMLAPLAVVADLLAHVHLSETNRDVLGEGHWPTAAFLRELARIGYQGVCSVGVYNTRRSRPECMRLCMKALKQADLAESTTPRSQNSHG